MKSLARSLMWWPGMDHEIEEMVKHCAECQRGQSAPPSAPLHPWKWPTRPWARLHVDFAGPMDGRMYLIVVDAHSKWMEVLPMTTATALTTVATATQNIVYEIWGTRSTGFRQWSSVHSSRVPTVLQTDGIRHIQVALYHPAANGLAERAVQTFKGGIRKFKEGSILETARVARFLMRYRVTPHTTTGSSPSELLLGRRL